MSCIFSTPHGDNTHTLTHWHTHTLTVHPEASHSQDEEILLKYMQELQIKWNLYYTYIHTHANEKTFCEYTWNNNCIILLGTQSGLFS